MDPRTRVSILYLQFTNPTAYPPLENSARILSSRCWKVSFLGVCWEGSGNFSFHNSLDDTVKLLNAPAPGWRQKLFFIRFLLVAWSSAKHKRVEWLYVSDPMAAPCGLFLSLLGYRVLYHEHDSPAEVPETGIQGLILWCRKALARRANLIVIPQHERARIFVEQTGTKRPVKVVWNCPIVQHPPTSVPVVRKTNEPLKIYFHGSINLSRVPLSLIDGAKRAGIPILLRVVGYETAGSLGAIASLHKAAEKAGSLVTLETPGSFSRHELDAQMTGMHIGWIACSDPGQDINLKYLIGASNKAFDYLAAGLPLVVRQEAKWIELFVRPGYARACDPEDPDSIASAIRWFYHHPKETAEMGRSGRKKILEEWNYERQFNEVIGSIEAPR